MTRSALTDKTNASALGQPGPAGGKKYSNGGTALGVYESFGGGGGDVADPALTRGAASAMLRSQSPAAAPPAEAEESSEFATLSEPQSPSDSQPATPTPCSSSSDAAGADTPTGVPGWHEAPAHAGAQRRALPSGLRVGGPPAQTDPRLLRAKVLALEDQCRALTSQNERLQRASSAAPHATRTQPRKQGGPAPSAWLSASRAPPQRTARRNAAVQAGGGGAAARAEEAARAPRHPVFGELLADFGYKRLYKSSARSLIEQVPIWCRQRPVEQARVAEIRASKLRHGLTFAGVISVFEMEPSSLHARLAHPQPVGIFDGQHRLCAISGMLASPSGRAGAPPAPAPEGGAPRAELCATRTAQPPLAAGPPADAAPRAEGEPLEDVQLLTEVFAVQSEEDVKHWFLELNKAEIVKEIDLPDTIAPSKKRTIDEAVDLLRSRYPDMFKPSERCRPPHVHRDSLRNKIFNHDIVGNALTDAQALLALLERVNLQLRARADGSWPESVRKALPKARAHGFFLGLNDYGWLEALSGIQMAL